VFHVLSPMPLKLARVEFGSRRVDFWLRSRCVRRVRTDSVDVLVLGSRGRRVLGLASGGRLPSLDGLKQLQARSAVLRGLLGGGWELVRFVSPFGFWVGRGGDLVLVVVNFRGYDVGGFRKRLPVLLNEVLVSGGSVMVFDRFPERLRRVVVGVGDVVSVWGLRDVLVVGYSHLLRGW
jgi:hypothetical protein